MESGSESPIRVLIVEDQTLLREALRRLLESENGVQVVGEAGTVAEALKLAADRAREFDVVLMDIRLPDGSGLDAAEALTQRYPGIRVLILTSYDDLALIERAMALHVAGYALKNSTYEELIGGLRMVRRGQTYLHPAIAHRLAEGVGSHLANTLTPTELRLLQLMADGLSYGEIAKKLYVSEKTVRRYATVLYSKMNVADKAQAVAEALRRGLLA
ncbi:MAG: response regulator transcription factor [Bacillota bacterium]|nr:response regulator transcription factor [Bacillota bacterium]